MQKTLIQTRKFLYETLYNDNTVELSEKHYRYYHSLRVSYIGKQLAKKEGVDLFLSELACLLHDVGKFSASSEEEHGRHSAVLARVFLTNLDLQASQIDDICYAIAKHVDGDAGYSYPHTALADIITDADNIDRFGAYRIYEFLKWNNFDNLDIHQQKELLEPRIKRMEENITKVTLETETGTALFRDNYGFQLIYFKNLYSQIIQTLEEMGENHGI